jgi:hypothetical protein
MIEMLRKALLFPVLLALLLASCNTSNSDDPVAVVEQYFSYWNSEDADGILSIVADEPEIEVDLAVMLSDEEKIRTAFERLFQRVDFQITVSDFEVDDNIVTYNYEIYVGDQLSERGRSQAVIENGKIKSERYIGPYAP